MKTIYTLLAFALCFCFVGAVHGSTTIPVRVPTTTEQTTAQEELVTGLCTFGGCPAETTTAPPETVPETEPPTVPVKTMVAPAADAPEEWDEDEQPATSTDAEPEEDPDEEYGGVIYSAGYFCRAGVIYWNGWRWTWYSERVLPGTGLHIQGRYTDASGYVRDGDGYICLASDDLYEGAVVATPFGGYGKVYDCGPGYGTLDVYVGW